jgi:hypothetical protein
MIVDTLFGYSAYTTKPEQADPDLDVTMTSAAQQALAAGAHPTVWLAAQLLASLARAAVWLPRRS